MDIFWKIVLHYIQGALRDKDPTEFAIAIRREIHDESMICLVWMLQMPVSVTCS